jgi:hypothetical protein
MIRRWRAVLLAVVLLGVVSGLAWRWQGQTVDLLIVNASPAGAEFSWQPRLFADLASAPIGACESKSIELRAGETWRFQNDQLDIGSSAFSIPLFDREVAIEIWIAPDGSSRLVSPYPVARALGAPYPSGCSTQPG